jgi:hypothetical protein
MQMLQGRGVEIPEQANRKVLIGLIDANGGLEGDGGADGDYDNLDGLTWT